MKGYLTVSQTAEKWDVTVRQVQVLCKQGRIEGAERMGGMWIIPESAEKPTRYKARSKKKPEDKKI
jgi:hypothetical protein